MNAPISMNRRDLLAALGVMPVAVLPEMASASPSFEYGTKPHAPLTLAEKAAIDGMDEITIRKAIVRPFAIARVNSLFARCDSAYTLAWSPDNHVDDALVRSLMPAINAGHAVFAKPHPGVVYAASRLGMDEARLAPLEVVEFRYAATRWTDGKKWHFTHTVPERHELSLYWPSIQAGPLSA